MTDQKKSSGSITRRSALGLGGIGVGAAALGVGNYYANKYAPIISTYLGTFSRSSGFTMDTGCLLTGSIRRFPVSKKP